MCDAGGPTGSSLRRRLDHELRRRSPVDRYESLTNLCPPSICGDLERQPFGQALEDASVVYGHRVVPESLRDGLPSIVSSWGDFGAEDDAGDSTQDAQNVDGQTYTDKAYSRSMRSPAAARQRRCTRSNPPERHGRGGEPSEYVRYPLCASLPWSESWASNQSWSAATTTGLFER